MCIRDSYNVDALKIAREVGMGNRINVVMQSCFFHIANVIPAAQAIDYIKQAVVKSYGNKGEKVVAMNFAAIDHSIAGLVEISIPDSWKNLQEPAKAEENLPLFITQIAQPMAAL